MAQKIRIDSDRGRLVGDAGCHSFAGWQRVARLRADLKSYGGQRAAEAMSGVPAKHFSSKVLGCAGVRFVTFANACEALGLSIVVLPTVADERSREKRWDFGADADADADKSRG